MASLLFQAIGRGYSAKTILSSLGKKVPSYANAINNAYHYGYTADQILSRIASKKDGKNYDPDMFLTDFEKTQRRDQDTKKNKILGSLAAAGTLAAAGAGLYALIQRNKPIQPQVLPALPTGRGRTGQKQPHTIVQGRPQLVNRQKGLAYNNPNQPPNKPNSPKGPLPYYPSKQQQTQHPQPPSPQPPVSPQSPQNMQHSTPPSNNSNVNLVNNLKDQPIFKNIISAGFDPDFTELAIRSVLDRDTLSVMDTTNGGLSQVIKDYSEYLKDANQDQKAEREQQHKQTQQEPQFNPQQSPAEQVGQAQLPSMQQQGQQPQAMQQRPPEQPEIPKPQSQQRQQPIAPIEQPQVKKPSEPSKPLVSLKNGKMGTLEGIEKGVASINVDGQIIKEKANQLSLENPEVEEAAEKLINMIPEGLKSTALMSTVYIPELQLQLNEFWDGRLAWYLGVPEAVYDEISLGTYTPKGEARTGIAEYSPEKSDSRGAGNSQEIVKNPLFSKENEGKTWGYAKNEYNFQHSIQKALHKISKKRYDKEGNLIAPKTREKKPEGAKVEKKEDKPMKETKKERSKEDVEKDKQIKKYEKILKNEKGSYIDPNNKAYYEEQLVRLKGEKIDEKKDLSLFTRKFLSELSASRNKLLFDIQEDENPQNLSDYYRHIKNSNSTREEKQNALDTIKDALKSSGYKEG